jgi:hydrophobic/amphiphilic exporter-1 (mainly G- bacteria), HAE1 family
VGSRITAKDFDNSSRGYSFEAAVEAARARLRPILMSRLPSSWASRRSWSRPVPVRKSIGITVFSGMIASTCLAVVFVPSFFVVVQRFEEWRAARRKHRSAKLAPAE